MNDWSPFIYAVAHQELELVNYFLSTKKLLLNHIGVITAKPTICLQIAITLENADLFEELWSHYNVWDAGDLLEVF